MSVTATDNPQNKSLENPANLPERPVVLAATDNSKDKPNPDNDKDKNKDNEGGKTLGEDDVLPPLNNLDPKKQDEDKITYQYEGKTYTVDRNETPFKHSILEGKLLGTEIDKTDNNVEVKVPPSSTTDFMEAKTTEDGKTVGELFHDNMKKEWGDLDLDDPRRQYFELMEAKSALVAGYDYLPHQVEKDAFAWKGDTSTYLKDSVIMDQASTYGLLKEEEIAEKLATLAEKPEIVEGVDKLMRDATSKIEDKRGLTENVYETMSDEKYMKMLEEMDPDAAKVRFANDLKSLDFLDKEKATDIRNKFLDQGLTDELTSIVESGNYDPESFEVAVSDTVQQALQGTFSSIFGIGFADKAVQNYLKDGSGNLPDEVKKGLDSYKDAVNIAKNAVSSSFAENKKFDIKDVTSRINEGIKATNADVPNQVRNGAAALLNGSLMNGALPAAGGMLAGTAAVYGLMKNKGETLEDRMAAARALLITVATSPALAQAGASAWGAIFDKPGMTKMLGLEDNTQLREVFEKRFTNAGTSPVDVELESLDPDRPSSAGSERPPALAALDEIDLDDWSRGLVDDLNGVIDREGERAFSVTMSDVDERISDVETTRSESLSSAYESATDAERRSIAATVDSRVSSMGLDPSELDTPSKLRIVGSVMGTVGGLADLTGGVLDIALGAMSIDKLMKNPDAMPEEYAGATMQLLGGASIVGMAGTSLASMIAGPATAATLGVVSGALGIAGVAFGGISAIIAGVVAKKKQDQKAEDVRQDFRDWGTLGVTEDNWGDKLNYTIHARHEYNYHHGTAEYYDLYPEGKPVWEARPEQYKDFTGYVSKHGNVSDDWFDKWDKDNDQEIEDQKGTKDPSGLPRFGDDGKPGTFKDFKHDVDRVDVGSIEMADDGRVIFEKDGVKQVIDPQIGGKAGDNERRQIIDYLKDLYQISHPGGKKDQGIVDKITKLHDESDNYNEIDDLKRAIDDSQPPLFGKDGNRKVGTFNDFREDIDRVDIGSIKPDSKDSSVIYFEKDGQKWQLDKDDSGELGDKEAEKIYDYLNNLYVMTHPDGKADQKLIDQISELFGKSDDYNDLDDLKDELELDKDSSGLPVFGDGGSPGTFGDFREDIDRVDVGSIELAEGGRVIFEKDGVKQVINPSDGTDADQKTRKEIIRYLEGLHDLARPDGKLDDDRVKMMNDIFGRTDKYNDLDKIRNKIDMEESADGLPFFGDGGKPGKFGDFKEDVDRVDVASIEILDNGNVIFEKDGVKQVVSVSYGDDAGKGTREDVLKYLKELHKIANPDGKFDQRIADEMNDVFGRTDKYNDPDKIRDYIDNEDWR